jgi:hypothetical protein
MILNEYGYNVFSNELRQLLGLPDKAKLPAEGLPARTVQGITIFVRPAPPSRGIRGGGKHRVRAICPECSKDVSAGRLQQHMTVHKDE